MQDLIGFRTSHTLSGLKIAGVTKENILFRIAQFSALHTLSWLQIIHV